MSIRRALLGLLFALSVSAGYAQEAGRTSSTTLSVEIGRATTPAGVIATLTAQVSAGQQPVSHGLVKFCDADAPRCDGVALLGTAQLNSHGQAVIHLRLGLGDRHLRAIFSGTPHSTPPFVESSSATQTVTVKVNVATVETGGRD